MKTVSATLAVCMMMLAGVASAKDGVANPVVKARMDTMQVIRVNTGVLGDMAAGKATFDATAAAAAKAALSAAAADIVVKFTENADDPVSEATPGIWADFAGFTTKANALAAAAAAVDVASLAGVQAGMGAISGGCKSCHEAFRAKK